MSRIGKQPIKIPENVTVEISRNEVVVKGPKGELKERLRPEIKVEQVENEIICSVKKDLPTAPAYWGLTRALIANMIKGVQDGYEKKLELVGVGYRAKMVGKNLEISVGFSHPVIYEAPEGIEFEVPDQREIFVRGISKDLVGLTAAKIRKIRKPEPYKGKGIKYADEVVRRKAGKAGKV